MKFGTLVENVVYDEDTRVSDYKDGSITENTRAGYPIEYIPNAAIPGVGGQPKTIVFLTADAFGVMPPIAKLTKEQAMYHFVSGYTSKLAGTERGIVQPRCLLLHLLWSALHAHGPKRLCRSSGVRRWISTM